jgi:hypothetical protein
MFSDSASALPAPSGDTQKSAAAAADALRGIERRRLLDRLLPLRLQGKTLKECGEILGESAATLCRIESKYRHGGTAGLKTRHANAGRRKLARVGPDGVFTETDVAFVKRLTIQTESLPLALERLSDTGTCSPEARALIDRYRESGNYPASFYELFHVTDAEWALAKGEKHFDGITHTARRGMFYLDEQGQRVELFAGGLVEADDVSTDVPYYLELPDGTFSVGRQVLCFRDVARRKYLGAYAVARERDSYRAEDIARACRELVEAWGMPDRFRFERGAWESAVVEGIKVDDGKGGDRQEKRWGGITQLIPVTHVHTSRGKGGIEGSFRMFHKVMGLFGVRIGKTRGEYEQPTADMLAVNEGRKHPRDCGFIPWSELLGKFEQGFTLLNGRPVYFQELGRKVAPDDAWMQDMQARARGQLPACPADLLWHFLPVKTEVGASIAQAGHVKVSVPGYPLPFFFRIGGPVLCHVGDGVPAEGIERIAPYIERGHRLIVCFDPQRAAEGAVIFNAERGPRNSEGWRPFQKLMLAPLACEAPQYSLAGSAHTAASPDLVAKRARDTQVRAAFTSIGLYGQGARRVRQDHDGAGNVARVESGQEARTSTRAAAPVQRVRTAPAAPARPPAIVEDLTDAPCESLPLERCRQFAPAQPPEFEDLDLR